MSKILIADDIEANRYLLEALLMGYGHQVTVCSNGKEALERALADPPDLAISDILMPVMDGFVLCRKWQEHAELKDKPFIFYTATYVDRKDEAFGLSLGAVLYLTKPMEPDELIRKVDALLQARTLKKEMEATREIDDSAYLQNYNAALFRKLQDKMQQLEEANRLLTVEVVERRQTELQLKRLSTAVEFAAESILIANANGRIEYVNPALEAALGRPGEDVIGKELAEISRQVCEVDPFPSLRKRVMNGQVLTNQLTARNSQGQKVDFDATVSPIQGSHSRIDGFVIVMRDVTERNKLEQHLAVSQKMEAIGTMAGGIAHDFNNILSAIVGYADLASFEVQADSRIGSHLESILSACGRAKTLVEQILTFSRKADREKVLLDLKLVIEESLKLLRATLPSTIEIRTHFQAESCPVAAEPVQLHQVLLNIGTNAAHAMREHDGVLEISLNRLDFDENTARQHQNLNPGEYYLVSIRDTGYGMTPEVMNRIFEPFFTTKALGEGTGLGLAVAHGIVRDHGGAIGAYSEPGKGSTFNIYLPVAQGQAISPKTVESGALPMGRERILLVDDEKTLVDVGQQILEKLGYQVTGYDSSRSALEAFLAQPDSFDLVITDQTMPGLSGTDLAGEVLKVRPGMPIVILTGYSANISDEKAKSLGVKKILMKPLVVRDVAWVVRNALDDSAPPTN